MPYRLLKHGKEHIGVINLDFKTRRHETYSASTDGDNSGEVKPKATDYRTS